MFPLNGKNTIIMLLFTQANVIFPAFVCLGFWIWHKSATNTHTPTTICIHSNANIRRCMPPCSHANARMPMLESRANRIVHGLSLWHKWKHFYSCFAINLVIEMTDFLLLTHMRMFTWYLLCYNVGSVPRHTYQIHFFIGSQLFAFLLFLLRLIKFGFAISIPLTFNHTQKYWHSIFFCAVHRTFKCCFT